MAAIFMTMSAELLRPPQDRHEVNTDPSCILPDHSMTGYKNFNLFPVFFCYYYLVPPEISISMRLAAHQQEISNQRISELNLKCVLLLGVVTVIGILMLILTFLWPF